MKTLICASVLGFCLSLPVLQAFSQTPQQPLGFMPEIIIYQNGAPVEIKLVEGIKPTIQDCLDALKAPVAMITSGGAPQGIYANGGCFPIPPVPAKPNIHKPATKL